MFNARIFRIRSPSRPVSWRFRPAAGSSSNSSWGSSASARDFHRPLLAERQRARRTVGQAGDVQQVQQLPGAGADARLLAAGVGRAEHAGQHAGAGADMAADHDIFQHVHVAEEFDVLEGTGQAGPGDAMRRPVADGAAAEDDLAAIGGQCAGDQVEQRGFTGAIGTDHGLDVLALDIEADVFDRVQSAEPAVELADLEQRRGHVRRLPRTHARKRSNVARARNPCGAKSIMPTRQPPKTASS